MKELFDKKLKVINVGLKSFKQALDKYEVESIQVDWRKPMLVKAEAQAIIRENDERIQKANHEAVNRVMKSKPYLVGLALAIDVIPGMKKNLILHAGPPITWERMCGPMRGAVIGALIYEGKAHDISSAEKLASSAEIEYAPCHEHNAVGPMAGIISPSMPVFIIKNETFGNTSYATMNEGLGKVLRYGAFEDNVITRLKWMEDVLYPSLKAAIEIAGRIDLQNIIAQALHMGD